MRPLHVLAFLFPLIVLYELGSLVFLSQPGGIKTDVRATSIFLEMFQAVGLVGAALPGIVLTTVLLVWHVLVKDRWKVDPHTLGGMLFESAAWTMPLLVLAAASSHARHLVGLPGLTSSLLLPSIPLAQAGQEAHSLMDMPLTTRATIAVGAGLYEEMLFRLVGLALLHFILVDLLVQPERRAFVIAVAISALGFALYHRPELPAEWPRFLFTFLAGVYFGTVYLMRGFGIVVGTHALYDILVLVIFPQLQQSP